MSEVNWDENERAAVEKFYEYLDEQGMHYANSSACIADFFEWLKSKQTKTIADAVDVFKRVWPEHMACGGCADVIVYDPPQKSWYVLSKGWSGGVDWYEVCNREQFEAYVKEQKSEKWTHTYNDYGATKDCTLIHDKPDDYGQVLVLNRRGEYVLTDNVKIKPIKPTLTKSQAWDKMCESEHEFDIVNRIKQMYDIID